MSHSLLIPSHTWYFVLRGDEGAAAHAGLLLHREVHDPATYMTERKKMTYQTGEEKRVLAIEQKIFATIVLHQLRTLGCGLADSARVVATDERLRVGDDGFEDSD